MPDQLFDNLNPVQQEAVRAVDGPVLVFAGAGSGKTRVLTYRIVHLIRDHGVAPWEILAVTFTNKAAEEMSTRIVDILGPDGENVRMSTFHSFGSNFLRREIERLGYDGDFTIYDAQDARSLISGIIDELGLDSKKITPRAAQGKIEEFKNNIMRPGDIDPDGGNAFDRAAVAIYKRYEEELKRANAVDFGNLILNTITILEQNEDLREKYRARFRYLLVDEYQDTNKAQYQLVKLLTSAEANVFVVGDDDQSIYRWRGADVGNILRFETDFPGARVFKLEQNYRSSSNIIKAAERVIRGNETRAEKTIWTANPEGEKIVYRHVNSELEEARYIADLIESFSAGGRSYRDVAIFYRTNAQSRVFEEEFIGRAIPYAVFGGMRFYERREIRDLLSYLKILANPADTISFRRAVNTPSRGIGTVTIGKVEAYAAEKGLDYINAIDFGIREGAYSKAISTKLGKFLALYRELAEAKENLGVDELMIKVIDMIGYVLQLKEENSEESHSRVENIEELVGSLGQFVESETIKPGGDPSLTSYLERISLINEIDFYDPQNDRVVMMTMHSAKGLEFPVVFIVGMEDGLFPHSRSFDDRAEMEEERRLCYVGITRAQKLLYLTSAATRRRFNNLIYSSPSRFLTDLPPEVVDGGLPLTFRGADDDVSLELFGDDFANTRFRKKEPGDAGARYSAGGRRGGRGSSDRAADYRGRLDALPDPKASPWKQNDRSNVYQTDMPTGSRVKHPTFGEGIVIAVEGAGEDQKVMVKFDRYGIKKLVIKFARLDKI